MASKYKFVIDRALPGGVRITTVLEYGGAPSRTDQSWFGPRHWCALEPRTNLPAPMTACGKVDSGMAFTTGVNGPQEVTCPECQRKLQDWLALIAAKELAKE